MNPYSAFYEVLSLSIEGVVMFAVLLILEAWLPRLNMSMTRLEPQFYGEVAVIARRASLATPALRRPVKGDEKAEDDTDVMLEDQVVAGLVGGVMMPSATPPFLVVSRLYKAYGYSTTNSVLQGLSFTVQKGECFGLLGVNGVGKTTMFRILTGQLLPHEGDALISGFSLVQSPRLFLRYIGYCPERDGLLDMLTGRETVLLFGRLRGVTLSPQYMHALLDTFRLSEYADQLVGTYSSGNRRKLSLCVATLGLPPLLLLDEPYVGISAGSLKRITNYISDLQKSLKLSIVLTSHSMSDVEFLCNRIAILSGGRLQCLGSLAHLKEKFGQGYTILVKTYPDRKQDAAYQHELANAITRVFPQADLIHTVEGQLEFRMSRVQELWSNMFIRMARIKRRFKLQDFFITDTSLEQIFLSVTRKEASDAAAAVATAAREPQATVQALLTATSLGI